MLFIRGIVSIVNVESVGYWQMIFKDLFLKEKFRKISPKMWNVIPQTQYSIHDHNYIYMHKISSFLETVNK